MLFKHLVATAASLLLCSPLSLASLGSRFHTHDKHPQHQKLSKRTYFPKPATDVKTITTPQGVKIRYKEPGKEGVCETTPGVGSYSGYIDLAPNVHVFFWFFESRNDPANDPLSLWLNGGPGSDSLIGLFQELGPCRITEDLESIINPYSWNNVSNMLFLSQPVGTGFSYQEIMNGSIGAGAGVATFLNSSQANVTGTYPILDPVDLGTIDTTDLAAMAAWHILQGFLGGMTQLNGDLKGVKDFNLWTESYGGHYGPSFFHYFQEQNAKITSGKMEGYALNMATLGIGNGIIDETVQAEWYPEFAVNNTYGIKAYNDTVYSYAKFANFMLNGCLYQIGLCEEAAASVNGGYVPAGNSGKAITYAATSNPSIATLCSEAADMCRDNVESPYYFYGGRGVYDIRHPLSDPTPPNFFEDYLNLAKVQNAIGVSVNYTDQSDIYWHFQSTGDFIYPNFLADLEDILDSGVRVTLYYGDADYICNWFGGEAISLALKYKNQKEFAQQGYAPMKWGGVEYGETREYGNFSFTRVYEAGHEVPYYQPQAMLALFDRAINYYDIASGTKKVTDTLGSGSDEPKSATHTEAPGTTPSVSGSATPTKYVQSLLSSYSHRDNEAPPTSGPIPTASSS